MRYLLMDTETGMHLRAMVLAVFMVMAFKLNLERELVTYQQKAQQ